MANAGKYRLQDPFAVYIQFKPQQKELRVTSRAQDDMELVINHLQLSGVTVKTAGTTVSGVGLKTGVVELVLITSQQPGQLLERLADAISKGPYFRLMKYFRDVPVPHLDLRHIYHSRPVNVIVNDKDSLRMTRLLISLANNNPMLTPMTVVLIRWAKQRKLLKTDKGYFDGFLFTLMTIFHQQQRNRMAVLSLPPPTCSEHDLSTATSWTLSAEVTSESLKNQLVDFFEFFVNFNFEHVIDIRPGCERIRPSGWACSPVGIIHPINGVNCAASVGRSQLQEAIDLFRNAAETLRDTGKIEM